MAGTRQLFALAWRESRTARRRLLLYMSSISLGVAALVAIDSFSENVIRSVHEQSRALLGGDVMLSGARPDTLACVFEIMRRAGIELRTTNEGVRIARNGSALDAVEVATEPTGDADELCERLVELAEKWAAGCIHARSELGDLGSEL